MKQAIRIVGEVLGVIVFVGLHATVIPLVLFMGAGLRQVTAHSHFYWAFTAGGYVALLGLSGWSLGRGRLGNAALSRRASFDLWLLAFCAAVIAAAASVALKFPLSFAGWDGHGFGAGGGEANAVFLPWLHLGVWLLLRKFRRPTTESAPDNG